MPIVEYTPDRFDAVEEMALQFHGQMNLAHPPVCGLLLRDARVLQTLSIFVRHG